MSDWVCIATDGYPVVPDSIGSPGGEFAHGGESGFFCWAPTFREAVVLDYYRNANAQGFCNSAGAWPEITHWQRIVLPKPPEL